MQQVLRISFRNLVRQKRRNLLLGIAIAFGAMVLILANAFSHGISRVLFEQVVRYTNGHVAISYMRNGNMMNQVFHDGERIRGVIKKEAPEAIRTEEGVGVFGRAIGNGVADNVIMVGVDLSGKLTEAEKKEFQANFKMLYGSFMSLNDKSAGIPVVLAEQKAKYLRVTMGDVLRVRFTDINNQSSSARLVVAGIFKPANVFMAAPIFLELQDARKLAGYGPHDIATVQLTLKDPQRTAKKVADRLHKALKPGLAVIPGRVQSNKLNLKIDCVTLGFRTDSTSLCLMSRNFRLARGDSARSFGYEGVVLSSRLAAALKAGPGDTMRVFWKARYDTVSGTAKFAVTGVADSAAPVPAVSLLVNERDFYHAYYDPLPPVLPPEIMRRMPKDSANPLWPALAPEYLLMKRCATTEEYTKITHEMGRAKFKGIMMSVQSMYETASAILHVEAALNLITLVACLILFFIILIGVINTLRMTIRERTREIGTVRAIGMQKGDVRMMFILETALLAFFASLVGTAASFLAMAGLHSFTIDAGDNALGILLVNNHLFFAPTVAATIAYVALIVGIAIGTAYFPARRASNLSAANAMRHYE
jgi:ABC-type lipoprotein release transport system permease subunit